MPAPSKPFSWSFSRLKAFESCPKRHYHLDIAKDVTEPESDQLAEGSAVHAAMAARLDPTRKKPLPLSMDYLEPWVKSLEKAAGSEGRIGTELKAALTRDFGSTTFFARDVWFRGIIDAMVLRGSVAIIGDWKTGKVTDDNPQLALFAQLVFAQRPEVQRVRTIFFWTKTVEKTTKDWNREDMAGFWASMLPRVAVLKKAHDTSEYPAKPGRLCKRWCPVVQCVHNGI